MIEHALTHLLTIAYAGPPSGTPSSGASVAASSPSLVDSIFTFGTVYNIICNVLAALLLAASPKIIAWWRDRVKRDRPYWIASATLLRETLFEELPESFRFKLIVRILGRLERETGLSKQLLRGTRLFIEDCLLDAAANDRAAVPSKATVRRMFDGLVDSIDAVHGHSLVSPTPVTFENCFRLDPIRDYGAKYFASLMKLESDPPARIKPGTLSIDDIDHFITTVNVNDGFVAPTFLVTGLLQTFETQWPGALRSFDKELGSHSVDFTLLQRFELYCWLLWGPSIPACSCNGWSGAFIVLQYGYGDEANSFPLLLEGEMLRATWIKALREKIAEVGDDGASPLPLAFAAKISGTLVWGPRYELDDDTDYPGIYSVQTPEKDRARLPNGEATILGGLMLRADTISWLVERRQYYSAYMWIMFEVCRDDEPPPQDPAQRWRRLFPVFEHVNIADGETLLFLKHRLAEKALKTVEDLESTSGGKLHMRYLCATDDPGTVWPDDHGPHFFRYAADPKTEAGLRNHKLRGSSRPVRDAMLAELASNDDHLLRTMMGEALSGVERSGEKRARLFAPADDPDAVITACDLPQIIEDFYRSFARPTTPP